MKSRMSRIAAVMTAAALLAAAALPVRAADAYEPLTVTVSLDDAFTTDDESADGTFRYLVQAVTPANAPLPEEADDEGAFTVDTKSGLSSSDGTSTVYTAAKTLTFILTGVGTYSYTLKEDTASDGTRENADRYTFDDSTYTVNFYVVYGENAGTLALSATTIVGPDGEKVEGIEFEQSYKTPELPPPPPPTGDRFRIWIYVALGVAALAGLTVLLVTRRKKEADDEKNA